jgi:hypothetical protein
MQTKVETMQATYPTTEKSNSERAGTYLSVAGLVAWLSAMLLAVAGPLLGVPVPPLVIVSIIVVSAIFTVLSLPKLHDTARSSSDEHAPPR